MMARVKNWFHRRPKSELDQATDLTSGAQLFRVTAAFSHPMLMDTGWSAEELARAVSKRWHEHLVEAIEEYREEHAA